MRNFVKSALFSALLLLMLTGTDIKAGPITGGIGAGIVLGAGTVWNWVKGSSVPTPVTVAIFKITGDVDESTFMPVSKPKYVGFVGTAAAVVGWIGTCLPLP